MNSCKKNNTDNTNNTNPIFNGYDFIYTGTLYIGDTIIFHSTAPYDSTLLWNFGDDSMSTAKMPVHIYMQTGTYVLTLLINNDSASVIRKTITVTDPPGCQYTHLMSGTRHWYGSIRPYMQNYYTVNDTSFAVQVVNDITVSVGGINMQYCGYAAFGTDSVLEFTRSLPPYFFYALSYCVKSDSMILEVDIYHNADSYYHTL